MNDFKIGDRVTDGFENGTVIEVEERKHGRSDYIVLMDGETKTQLFEESFLELEETNKNE